MNEFLIGAFVFFVIGIIFFYLVFKSFDERAKNCEDCNPYGSHRSARQKRDRHGRFKK